MNKNDKDFMNQFNNLNDVSVEEIAEKYPGLRKKTKKRILKQCMKKDVFSAESGSEGKDAITISGTERYKRKHLYRFAASAAAFVVAVGGITSMFVLNRHINGDDISETEKTSAVIISESLTDSDSNQTMATAPNRDKIGSWENTKPGASDSTNMSISLKGTCWTNLNDGGPIEKTIEFAEDGVSGEYIIFPENVITTDSTKIPFTYEQNGYDITFSIGPDDTVKGKFSTADWRVMLTIEWQDGHTECFWTSKDNVMTSTQIASSKNDDMNGTSQTPQTTEVSTAPEGMPVNNNSISFDLISLNKTNWYEKVDAIGNSIEFSNDGFSGHYITPSKNMVTTNATKTYFTYTQNGNEILFYAGSDTATGKLSTDAQGQKITLTLVWANGNTEYFDTHDITIESDGSFKYAVKDNGYDSQYPLANDGLAFLNGTDWYEYELDGPTENFIEFSNDSYSGNYGTPPEDYVTADAAKIYFTYTQSGNEIIFYIGSDTATGTLSVNEQDPRGPAVLTLVWANGTTEYFYNNTIPVTCLQN